MSALRCLWADFGTYSRREGELCATFARRQNLPQERREKVREVAALNPETLNSHR